ncbi:MAG: hypothetical protein P8Y25_15825 [Chromatiaceae bacterium]
MVTASTDVAGEQAVAATRVQGPNPAVEGAPVKDLQAVQTVAREGVVGEEVELKGLYVIHRVEDPFTTKGTKNPKMRTKAKLRGGGHLLLQTD